MGQDKRLLIYPTWWNNQNIGKKWFSSHWTSDNEGMSSLKDGKQTEWTLQLSQLTILIELADNSTGYAEPGWARQAPCVRDGAGGRRRPRWLEFTGQNSRKKRASQSKNHWGSVESSLEYLVENWSAHSCEVATGGRGKKQLKESEGTMLGAHTGLGIVPIPISHTWKPHYLQDKGQSTQNRPALGVGTKSWTVYTDLGWFCH